MDINKYGTRAWIESQYCASEDDPWGLNWRPSQRYRYVRMFDALKSMMLATPRPLAIVDVGCATGGFTSMLGALNGGAGDGLLIGVDIAESAVARAVARFPHIRFECMALDECAAKYAGTADIVSCMEVLYYLPREQRAEAARQLKSMLKPGGCLLVSSMIASAPYFSFGELTALLSNELNVVEAGMLYLKPFVLREKFLMKLRGTAARRSATYDDAKVDRWSRCAGRFFPRFTGSHAYVIAHKTSGNALPMHLLTVSTYFPNAADPQRAVFVKNLVRAMQPRCHIEVISPVPYAPPFGLKPEWRDLGTIPALESIDGIDVAHPRFVVLPRLGWLSGLGYFLGILGALRHHANSGRRIVVHAHCAYPDAVGVAIAARLLRLPYVVTAHGSDINVYAERSTLRFQIRWALRHAAGVIAVSGALQAKITRLLGSAKTPPISCIPCAGFDPHIFFPRSRLKARAVLKVDPHASLVVFVGQLTPVKGVEYLINAWAELRRRAGLGAMDCLVLIGDGPCRSSLERQITSAGLAGRVQFSGTLNQIEVACWMAAASLLCLPSLNEGTPNVIVEALASGVPVVASRVGGVPDLIHQGENGLLVSPADSIALADALEWVLKRDWDACAIADSVSNLTWQAMADRNCDFLRSLF